MHSDIHCQFLNRLCFTTLLFTIDRIGGSVANREDSTAYWIENGVQNVRAQLQKQLNENPAKNVILFIGDGLGIPAITSGRIYRAQKEKLESNQTPLSFELFPFTGLSKTYSVDRHTTDSSSAATAFLCGVKARQKTAGVGPEVTRGDCQQALRHPVDSVATWAIQQGKWAGVVTTTRVTHATPAALYAHVASRYWESDNRRRWDDKADSTTTDCKDTARQLIEDDPGRQLRVILGGGRAPFMPRTRRDPEYSNKTGYRLDGRDLVQEWQNLGGERPFVWNREQLNQIDPGKTDYLLGLFELNHMKTEIQKKVEGDVDGDPDIEEMTRKAIELLRRNENGYFLLVESGRIDHGLHGNQAIVMLEEVRALHRAVATAVAESDDADTLVVLTADHSHAMSFVGYPDRQLPILGKFTSEQSTDGLPTTILVFANGQAANLHNGTTGRRNLTDVDTEAVDFRQPAFMPTRSESHGGEDVAVYARGPWAHLLSGTQENTAVAHVIAFAMCAGPARQLCQQHHPNNGSRGTLTSHNSGNGTAVIVGCLFILVSFLFCIAVVSIVVLLKRIRQLRNNCNVLHELKEVRC